jgi:hypothetical protein
MRRLSLLAVLLFAVCPLFATEPNPSLRQRELCEQLLNLMQMDKTVSGVVDAVYEQIQNQFLQQAAANGNSEEDVAEAKELFESFRAAAGKVDFTGLMKESFIHIYAKYFTEQELTDLIAFYTTPTGRKTITIMDDLMREGMQVGVEKLAPKIDEVTKEALEAHQKKRPWRRTMSDMRSVATALEAYSIDNERYPSGDYAALKELLKEYIDEFPEKDIWDHAYAYVVADDGHAYRLVSAGADSIFDWDSRRIVANDGEATAIRYRDRLEDDIIFADGAFVQLPVQAKPKE